MQTQHREEALIIGGTCTQRHFYPDIMPSPGVTLKR